MVEEVRFAMRELKSGGIVEFPHTQVNSNPSILNPKPQALNPQPSTLNPRPQTPNPKP